MWIKICGIHDDPTAREVADRLPNAIGLNFYRKTPRTVSIDVAAEIVRNLPEAVEPVGLFVNRSAEEILSTCRDCRLGTVQLHGEEPPGLLLELHKGDQQLRIIRVHRLGMEGLNPLAEYLDECHELNVKIFACLIDARVEGMYGGSGKTVSWSVLEKGYRRDDWPPMILAGGLNPDNVATAIETVDPWGVDVANGVELTPGKKHLGLVSQFIQAARAASKAVEERDG